MCNVRIRSVITLSVLAAFASCADLNRSKRDSSGRDGANESTVTPPSTAGQTASPPSSALPTATPSNGVYLEHNQDGSEVAVLASEPDYLTARWNLLNSAKQAVWIQTYIFKADYTGRQFAKKLLELKRKGIDVKVVVDEQINLSLSAQSQFASMYQNGLKVIGFNPLYRGIVFPLSESGNIGVFLSQQNKRSHEKMFIIDPMDPVNKRAIIGGVNIADDYFRILPNEGGGFWRDKDVMLKGPIVDDIATEFSRSLAYHTALNANISAGAALPSSLSTIIQGLLTKPSVDNPVAVQNFAHHIAQPLQLNWQPVKVQLFTQSMVTGHSGIYDEYLKLFSEATSEIIIANGYFIPNQEQVDALKAAARRGVRVRILTNSEVTTDYQQVARAGRLMYSTVLSEPALPIEIYEWGVPGRLDFGLYHPKYACIDRLKCLVGSYNFDPRSRKLNNEVAITFENGISASFLADQFNQDVQPSTATKVTPELMKEIDNPTSLKDKALNTLIKSFLHIF